MRGAGEILLVSCYELGHQPFAIASAWAQLEAAGFGVDGVDASLDAVTDDAIDRARLVAISVPMHTALRLGVEIARRVRATSPRAHVCFFGLYASMNAEHLLAELGDSVIGGEFESALVALAQALAASESAPTEVEGVALAARDGAGGRPGAARPILRRLAFVVPRRDRLPGLERYAELVGPGPDERRTVGYAEASRGCLHTCRHCPITPVYDGRFFVVPREVVLADVDQQVAAGARHITFGDPDFMNGVGHGVAIARELHARHPTVTFDVTIKVEHILRHRERFAELAELGCLFVISAFESMSDRVLAELDKGHTRQDALEALRIAGDAGIPLRPTFVAFTPWTTLADYIALCDLIANEGLAAAVDPIQLAIRLLIPPGSALLREDAPRPWLGPFAPEQFGHRWTHPDPAMDRLHADVTRAVEASARTSSSPERTFAEIRGLAYRAAGGEAPPWPSRAHRFVPRLTEPWFCCAEPSAELLEQVAPHGGELAKRAGCCDDDARPSRET